MCLSLENWFDWSICSLQLPMWLNFVILRDQIFSNFSLFFVIKRFSINVAERSATETDKFPRPTKVKKCLFIPTIYFFCEDHECFLSAYVTILKRSSSAFEHFLSIFSAAGKILFLVAKEIFGCFCIWIVSVPIGKNCHNLRVVSAIIYGGNLHNDRSIKPGFRCKTIMPYGRSFCSHNSLWYSISVNILNARSLIRDLNVAQNVLAEQINATFS